VFLNHISSRMQTNQRFYELFHVSPVSHFNAFVRSKYKMEEKRCFSLNQESKGCLSRQSQRIASRIGAERL